MQRATQQSGKNLKSFTPEDIRRRRQDETSDLRKQNRRDLLQKRRNLNGEAVPTIPVSVAVDLQSLPNPNSDSLRELSAYAAIVKSGVGDVLSATKAIRKMLSIDSDPPIDAVIESGVVSPFIQILLTPNVSDDLKLEACWALTNIASGNSAQTRCVVEAGGINAFKCCLNHGNLELIDQAVWALGNIAGDSAAFRDLILGYDILDRLCQLTRPVNGAETSLLRNATWTISNLCRGRPSPAFAKVSLALQDLCRILLNVNDAGIIADTCWALSYLSDGSNAQIAEVMRYNITDKLVKVIMSPQQEVVSPALRVLGNFVSGDQFQTQEVLRAGVLVPFKKLLTKSARKTIRKEVTWAISNITAGTRQQVDMVIKSDIIPAVIQQLEQAELDIKKEAAWCIANAASVGDGEHVKYLVAHGCMKPLCELLTAADVKILEVAMQAIENILDWGSQNLDDNGDNRYLLIVEEVDGLDRLEHLQLHTNPKISKEAQKIICKYWDVENESIAQNLAPKTSSANTFQFGRSSNIPVTGFYDV